MAVVPVGTGALRVIIRHSPTCCGVMEVGAVLWEKHTERGEEIDPVQSISSLIRTLFNYRCECASYTLYGYDGCSLYSAFIGPALEEGLEQVEVEDYVYNVRVSEEFYNPNSGNMLRQLHLTLDSGGKDYWDDEELDDWDDGYV